MFRTVPLSIISSFSLYTQQWYMSYRFSDSSQAVSKPVWHIPLMCVQWKTPDNGQRNFPTHVEFYSKNKFEKLVHLVGFGTRKCCKLHIGKCHTGLLTACEQDQDCQQTCMTYTTAVCTVKNSWWWTEELSETRRVLFQKWTWEISASGWC